MKNQLSGLFAAALIVLSGCSRTAILEKIAPTDVQAASKEAVEDLKARHFESLKERLTDELKQKNLDEAFEKMAAAFPDERPQAILPLSFVAVTGPGGTKFDISYEYEFSKTWVIVRINWIRVNSSLRILSFDVHARDTSLEEVNAFTFRGKGAIHYVVLLLGALAVVISITALIKCIRAKNLRKKWLWIIFILFGFGALSLNWTTGQWHVAIFNCELLSFSAFAPFGGPWTVAVSVPVGAVAFLEKLRKERQAKETAATLETPPLV